MARSAGISPLTNLKAPYKKRPDQTAINQIARVFADASTRGGVAGAMGDLIIRGPNSVMNVMATSR